MSGGDLAAAQPALARIRGAAWQAALPGGMAASATAGRLAPRPVRLEHYHQRNDQCDRELDDDAQGREGDRG
jgi:hypothetical protein